MWIEFLGALALALTLPGSVYLATLTAAAAWPVRRKNTGAAAAALAPRLVIVVPAHNESLGLLRTLRSLQREVASDTRTRIVVVADNCSDNTADVARSAGVEVLERHDDARRGKGHALRYAFDTLNDADGFIVIDADTDVEPAFLCAMRAALAGGADALQCRYGVRDALAHRRATLADVALGAWNVLRPRGRATLGLSAGILGNGFALSRRALQAVPYSADSIVEDVEYHHLLVRAGLRVQWVDGAQVRGDMPAARSAAAQQRARWEGGRLRLLASQGPTLAARVLAGQWRLADPLLDLLLWPLAWHTSLLLLALALGAAPVQIAAGAGLAVVALHVALALWLMPARREHFRALLGAPAYVAWKL
ncbi:MAG TPA: glycosyltransferase family 2 protein, partial [Rubrivivax sp.]|nr:glycosyltransferase family 2 protein [Rubrivivax sp.]